MAACRASTCRCFQKGQAQLTIPTRYRLLTTPANTFQKEGSGWVEYSPDGAVYARFEEAERSAEHFDLWDASRSLVVKAPSRGLVRFSRPNDMTNWTDLLFAQIMP